MMTIYLASCLQIDALHQSGDIWWHWILTSFVIALLDFGVDTATMVIESEAANYLQCELSSLGIECKRTNELNDKGELEALATIIKEAYFQDYKTAYDAGSIVIDKSHFDHLI